MSNILGLDLGTNSIGWAVVDNEQKTIVNAGSRIIPMDEATLGQYETGNLKSQASVRTDFRSIRRLYERAKLRRERLLRVLHVMGFLPEHFDNQIDFINHLGQFKSHSEPLLPYRKNADGRNEFIFNYSFREMVDEFNSIHSNDKFTGKRIPYDWTIYYLRHKALSMPIRREELAWIILQFNTKRGYYQLRGEEEETKTSKNETYEVLTVKNVEKLNADSKRRGIFWYEITYDNGISQRKSGPVAPRKIGDQVELIVTTTLDKNGNVAKDKEGNPKIKLRDPKPDDWTLMKKRTERAISDSGTTVGDYIYNYLMNHPEAKIRGKQVRTIERKYYKDELKKILDKQAELIPELKDSSLLEKCVLELYRNNEAHVASLQGKTFTDFIVDDIIFYQRPLKSKKSLIANCPFEEYCWIDKSTGEIHHEPIKVIPKSHPLYQEFRIRQFLQNLKVIRKEKEIDGKLKTDVDVTCDYLKDDNDWQKLYNYLSSIPSIDNKKFCKYLGLSDNDYRWNYVTNDKSYPCAETHCLININGDLNKSQETELWHIMYSVSDPIELRKALTTFADKNGLDEHDFIESHIHIKPFDSDFGAFSEKALKKILPLMRRGIDWHEEDLPCQARERIHDIINGNVDEKIRKQIVKSGLVLNTIADFNNLPLWFAEYLVYGQKDDITVWNTPDDIDKYLQSEFRQHSLRNPIVETVLSETLRVVRDIWKAYGKPDEIHIEMGRDLKQPKDKRARATQRILENERTNLRIRQLLQEFAEDSDVENVRPNSPSQMELFKIFENDVLNQYDRVADPDNIMDIVDSLANPTKHVSHNDIVRYKCWLEQRYQSPYTGDIIPLSRLFTTDYEIEHVIPQSRYFDDSLNNKVICESGINKLKGNRLGYEFIFKEHGHIVDGHKVFEKEAYEQFVKDHYSNNPRKARILLLEDIPDSFIRRQLNDSRYIARQTTSILSAAVRSTDDKGHVAANDRGSVSVNIIATNGSITDRLKKEWGITQIWNHIIAPRFIRLNEKTHSEQFGKWVEKNGERYFQINIPLEISSGFSKKRIDHRHHAMDAIVIACTTRSHINYLNNSTAAASRKDERHDLRNKLCFKDKTDSNGNYSWRFIKPWTTFTEDTKAALDSIIVSFKQNLRVINKTSNFYWHYENGKKVLKKQTKGDGWALRKSLHKATVSGAVRLQSQKTVRLKDALANWHLIVDKTIRAGIKHVIKDIYHGKIDQKTLLKYFKDRDYKLDGKDISKLNIWFTPAVPEATASRTKLNETFDKKNIEKITDSGIRKILLRHLENCGGNPKVAFSPDGIAMMNDNIKSLNNGKDHKPILSVRKYDAIGNKFRIGEYGSKSKGYVVADKGTNIFFAIYNSNKGIRTYESIPYNVEVERQKQGLPIAPEENSKGDKLLFVLSPGDLVYMPNENEHVDKNLDKGRIWKFVSTSLGRAQFVPERLAVPIADNMEYAKNKTEFDDYHRSIKAFCRKIIVDRLGRITKIE